ncbi:MAG: arginyltransferase [Gammaproteobacteria bacterium]|jgi:arginine-tRNA-protein transferase|nr:arginyltransferase [Gammaproteobacteria bacterium]|tara:strand:- start:1327 stop:2040 length:714 start_codon:yes stop_codon:yes gene_type:complete
MTSLSELRFFTTPEHDCSYLDDRQAITLFVDPLAKITTDMYSGLSAVGFRRSGDHIYRPYCQACAACIPVRIPVADFTLKRRHNRIINRNSDVVVKQVAPCVNEEYFNLYHNYIDARHADGDMYPAEIEQFESFLVLGRQEAIFFEFRAKGDLLAVAVADKLNDGLSAIYTFFDPEKEKRSPGVLAVIHLIEETRRLSLGYVYLGYWIKQCQKMAYKMDYKPIELYVNNRWVPILVD